MSDFAGFADSIRDAGNYLLFSNRKFQHVCIYFILLVYKLQIRYVHCVKVSQVLGVLKRLYHVNYC